MSSFEERRRSRATWPVRIVRLGSEELVDARGATSVDARLALVATLTRQLWAFTGQPLPDYERATMPGRVLRRR